MVKRQRDAATRNRDGHHDGDDGRAAKRRRSGAICEEWDDGHDTAVEIDDPEPSRDGCKVPGTWIICVPEFDKWTSDITRNIERQIEAIAETGRAISSYVNVLWEADDASRCDIRDCCGQAYSHMALHAREKTEWRMTLDWMRADVFNSWVRVYSQSYLIRQREKTEPDQLRRELEWIRFMAINIPAREEAMREVAYWMSFYVEIVRDLDRLCNSVPYDTESLGRMPVPLDDTAKTTLGMMNSIFRRSMAVYEMAAMSHDLAMGA